MLIPLPAGALMCVHLRRLAEGFRIRLGPAQVGLLCHVRLGRDGIELLRRGVVRDVRYLQQGMALWPEVAEPFQGVGPGTWAVWDGGARFVRHDGAWRWRPTSGRGALRAKEDVGGRWAPRRRLRRDAGGGDEIGPSAGLRRAGHGWGGVGITDLLRGSEAGHAIRLAPDPPGLALFSEGPMQLWASGTGEPGMWGLEGVAYA